MCVQNIMGQAQDSCCAAKREREERRKKCWVPRKTKIQRGKLHQILRLTNNFICLGSLAFPTYQDSGLPLRSNWTGLISYSFASWEFHAHGSGQPHPMALLSIIFTVKLRYPHSHELWVCGRNGSPDHLWTTFHILLPLF